MRESRAAINSKYWPTTAEEAVAVLKTDHPLNAPFRQVVTYWEMVYGMVKWGVLHPDFMMESNGEGMLVFAKAEAHLEAIREQGNPTYFANAEWVATNTEAGQRALQRYRERVRRFAASR